MKIRIGKKTYRLKKQVVFILLGVMLLCIFFAWTKDNKTKNGENIIENIKDIDKDYDSKQNEIETEKYTEVILQETKEADNTYVSETLFLGDSNTARFLKTIDDEGKTYVTKDNSIGVVGMGIDAISSLACLDTSNGRVTMVKAVSLLQPKRIIITFGTNNLYGNSTETTSFIDRYEKQLKNIVDSYPSVDLIINSIPPVSKNRAYPNVSMIQIDAYNKAILEMCEKNKWKYLNSSEILKDESTGYAKEGYMLNDGLHLSSKGIEALFKYIKTHSYVSEDDRPKPLAKIPTIIGVPSGLIQTNPLNSKKFEEEIIEESTTSVSCKENAWGDPNGCYCNEGYQGNPYEGCTLIPTPTPTPTITVNCGSSAYFDANTNSCVCYNQNETWDSLNNQCVVIQNEQPVPTETTVPEETLPSETVIPSEEPAPTQESEAPSEPTSDTVSKPPV